MLSIGIAEIKAPASLVASTFHSGYQSVWFSIYGFCLLPTGTSSDSPPASVQSPNSPLTAFGLPVNIIIVLLSKIQFGNYVER